MGAWGEERVVRAEVLRYLLVGDEWPVAAKGVRLRGVRISGHLDLEAATVRCPLSLESCYLDAGEPVCLDHATVPRLILTRCQLPGLTGRMLSAREVDLSGSILTGPLVVLGADITGQFSCRGTQLTGTGSHGSALVANGMKVGGDVFLDRGFTAAGAVRLIGADITGQLNCSGAQLTGTGSHGSALVANGMKVGGDVFLDRGFTAAGAVRLIGADIAGQLNCSGAQLTGTDNDGRALVADGMKVGGGVFLARGFTATGAVALRSAEITSVLTCRGAQLTGTDTDGNALFAEAIKVGGGVFLAGGFTAKGAVRLTFADITGQLNCSGAQLTGTGSHGSALVANGMKVGGDVFLDRGFTAAGAVRLIGADITGQLNCSGAQLTGTDSQGYALVADGTKVSRSVFLDREFTAAGTISLISVHIGGSVYLMPTALADGNDVALSAARAQIAGTLRWAPARQVAGRVTLEDATVGQVSDDWSSQRPNGYWPTEGRLRLDGFAYSRFGGDQQATVEQRLAWVRSQYHPPAQGRATELATQPYEQLATVYRQAGKETQARKVAIARRADLRKYGNLSPYRWFGNWLLDKTIKYGYQSWRAGVGLAAVFVIFTMLSFLAQQHHLIVPVGNFKGAAPSATKCTSNYPCFYPPGYAIDTVIPIINVHQADNWGPDGSAPWGRAFVAATWIATGLGWALATLLVAGYTGLVRQD